MAVALVSQALQALPLGLSPEQLAAASGTLMMAIMLVLVLRGELITKRDHERAVKLYEQRLDDKDEAIVRIEADRDLWRNVAADALNVSEALAGRRA